MFRVYKCEIVAGRSEKAYFVPTGGRTSYVNDNSIIYSQSCYKNSHFYSVTHVIALYEGG